jgi:DNA repair exonuclease SbcCD nuclease subunit
LTSLWSSDLHLNEVPRDSFRWDILPWLERTALNLKVDFIGLAGDTVDTKDRHPASLVNRLTDFFAKSKNQWVILPGNHDYIDPNTPFFRYLSHFPNVSWINEPTKAVLPVDDIGRNVLLLPATKEWGRLWPKHLEQAYEYIFMHGTFAGTKSETGFELPGIPVEFFGSASFDYLYSGDIHTPGKISDGMYYIGAPYRVHFGDTYNPRVLHIGQSTTKDLVPPLKSRHVAVVRKAEDLVKFGEIEPEDQVKIRVRLKRSEFPEWRTIRSEIVAEAERLKWEICGVELLELTSVRRRVDGPQESESIRKGPEDYVRDYAKTQKLKQPVIDYGLKLLRGD